ncbi:hypothetical protein HK405_003745 [Cladochytrium tenue]|nr:hypothetical protein HK405_003745 [Cladochytrium tenue]
MTPPPPPPPAGNHSPHQPAALVTVAPLVAGTLSLADAEIFADTANAARASLPGADARRRVPSLAFVVRSRARPWTALFDLGIRKDLTAYPPAVCAELPDFACDLAAGDAADVLRAASSVAPAKAVDPDKVDAVILSHMHFDHVGDVTRFPNAAIYAARDACSAAASGFPANARSNYLQLPSGRDVRPVDFDDDAVAAQPFCNFPRSVDLLGDGSVYLLETPGHAAGHLAAACRVAPNRFVLLAADCCHARACYADAPPRMLSPFNYVDLARAQDTVNRLAAINHTYGPSVIRRHHKEGGGKHAAAAAAAAPPAGDDEPRVLIILAHETERLDEIPVYPDVIDDTTF